MTCAGCRLVRALLQPRRRRMAMLVLVVLPHGWLAAERWICGGMAGVRYVGVHRASSLQCNMPLTSACMHTCMLTV